MAGSLGHILEGWSFIENMGDAYESTEELLWLVLSQIGEEKAMELLKEEYFPMCTHQKERDEAFIRTRELMTK